MTVTVDAEKWEVWKGALKSVFGPGHFIVGPDALIWSNGYVAYSMPIEGGPDEFMAARAEDVNVFNATKGDGGLEVHFDNGLVWEGDNLITQVARRWLRALGRYLYTSIIDHSHFKATHRRYAGFTMHTRPIGEERVEISYEDSIRRIRLIQGPDANPQALEVLREEGAIYVPDGVTAKILRPFKGVNLLRLCVGYGGHDDRRIGLFFYACHRSGVWAMAGLNVTRNRVLEGPLRAIERWGWCLPPAPSAFNYHLTPAPMAHLQL